MITKQILFKSNLYNVNKFTFFCQESFWKKVNWPIKNGFIKSYRISKLNIQTPLNFINGLNKGSDKNKIKSLNGKLNHCLGIFGISKYQNGPIVKFVTNTLTSKKFNPIGVKNIGLYEIYYKNKINDQYVNNTQIVEIDTNSIDCFKLENSKMCDFIYENLQNKNLENKFLESFKWKCDFIKKQDGIHEKFHKIVKDPLNYDVCFEIFEFSNSTGKQLTCIYLNSIGIFF